MNNLMAICGLCLLVVSGCTMTAANTCDAIDAAHAVFLGEVEADPTAYTASQIRNERLAYATSKIACASYVKKNPAVN